MGVRILEDRETGQAAMYCSTTGVAFGPLMEDAEQMEEFLQWLPTDARKYKDHELGALLTKFLAEAEKREQEQEAREEAELARDEAEVASESERYGGQDTVNGVNPTDHDYHEARKQSEEEAIARSVRQVGF